MHLYRRFPEDLRFQLCHLQADRLGDGRSFPVSPVPGPLDYQEFLALGEAPVVPGRFADFDLVFSRADRPHPPGFMETLARYEDEVRFVVRPSGSGIAMPGSSTGRWLSASCHLAS